MPGKGKPGPAARELLALLESKKDAVQAPHLMRFFKTGPGQYGEGDRFLGLKVPVTRSVIKPYRDRLSDADYVFLLDSEWHEVRLAALLLMGGQAAAMAKRGDVDGLRGVAALYDRKLDRANNWDLVDLSAYAIMGSYWEGCVVPAGDVRECLKRWADSGNLWRERAAIISTLARQRTGNLQETFWLSEYYIEHPHDLMHKACGWMLREAGKRDIGALRSFLAAFHRRLPRTALRYAIERMDKEERDRWLRR